MGIYIDCVVQAKVEGVWKTVVYDYAIGRGLGIYHWLGYGANDEWADERGIQPITLPRGLPADYVPDSALDLSDAHYDRTWLTAEEILAAPWPAYEERDRKDIPPDDTPSWSGDGEGTVYNVAALMADLRRFQRDHGEVRLVYGFG